MDSRVLAFFFPCLLCAASSACDANPPDPEPETDDPRAKILRVNEVVASNASGCPDEAQEFDDWIELVNLGDDDVDLEGVTISDDRASPDKASLSGLTISAKGHLVLFADGTLQQGANHLPFKLSAAGEEVVVFIDGAVVDEVTWTQAASDTALARFPDGKGDFVTCAATTCGASNGTACP
jgi:hypothetical protein